MTDDVNQSPDDTKPAFDKEANTGFTHFMNAATFSIKGFKAAYKNEAAFRQELALLVIATPVAVWLGSSWTQTAALIACILFVITVELLNSAVEAVVDRTGLEHHPLSGRAKDLGSAAVFVALILTCIVWLAAIVDRFL